MVRDGGIVRSWRAGHQGSIGIPILLRSRALDPGAVVGGLRLLLFLTVDRLVFGLLLLRAPVASVNVV